MAELFEEALPVVIVPEGTVKGEATLFDDPLPVYVVGETGGTVDLPARLGMSAQVLPDGTDLDDTSLGNGWYFCANFAGNPFGDAKPAFLEMVNGGNTFLQRLTDVESSNVDQRVGVSNWVPLNRLAD